MKKINHLALLLCCFYSYGQNSITYSKANGTTKHDHSGKQLTVPFELFFNQADYKDDLVEIIGYSAPSVKGKFGGDTIKPQGGSSNPYRIDVRPNSDSWTRLILNPFDANYPHSDTLIVKINGKPVDTLAYTSAYGHILNETIDYQPGYIYYDAMALVADNAVISPNTKSKILHSYGYFGGPDNPYLDSIYKSIGVNAQGLMSSLLATPVAGADITNFAAGLSRFLAERAKEELNEAFFSKMKQQLNAYPELSTVFPRTTAILNVIETYTYSSVLPVLKEAFNADSRNLPENIYDIKSLDSNSCNTVANGGQKMTAKDHDRCKTRLTALSDFFKTDDGQWLALGMYTMKEAIHSPNPAELLKTIVHSGEFETLENASLNAHNYTNLNLLASIELGNLISQSMVSKDSTRIWISQAQLNALLSTKGALEAYLGLLLAMEQTAEEKIVIKFYDSSHSPVTVGTLLKKIHQEYTTCKSQVRDLLKNIHSAYNSANNAMKNIIATSAKAVEADPQALYNYYTAVTSSLSAVAESPLLAKFVSKDLSAHYNRINQFLSPAADMAYHIAEKAYPAAFYDAVALFGKLPDSAFDNKVSKSFVRYGTLISTVATAQSSDEVKKAIDASVLPAGSYSIKRKTAWSISLNGYVGGYYGWAHTRVHDTVFNSSTNTVDTVTRSTVYRSAGLYAPIGFSFNRGFKCGWGFTFSTQIFDLGALVNYYLINGDGASLPTDFKVRVSDILSPGLQFGINLPKCPITVMGGVQYVPALNRVSQVSSTSELSPIAWRAQLGLVVDIPLYNLKVWDFK